MRRAIVGSFLLFAIVGCSKNPAPIDVKVGDEMVVGTSDRPKLVHATSDPKKKSIDELITDLDNDTFAISHAAVLELFVRGPDALKLALPTLRTFAKSENRDYRLALLIALILESPDDITNATAIVDPKSASDSLGPIGMPFNPNDVRDHAGKLVGPAMVKAITSADGKQRTAAIAVVSSLGSWRVRDVFAPIGKVITDPMTSREAQTELLTFLVRGGAGHDAIPALLAAKDEKLSPMILLIARFTPPDDFDPTILAPLLESSDANTKIEAAEILLATKLVEPAMNAILSHSWKEQMIPVGNAKGDAMRKVLWMPETFAFRFSRLPTDSLKVVLKMLTEAIEKGDEKRRQAALRIAELAGTAALPIWNSIPKDAPEEVRTRAVEALAKLGKTSLLPVPLPTPLKDDAPYPEVFAYVRKIGAIDPPTRETFDILTKYAENPMWTNIAITQLPTSGPFAKESVSLLVKSLGMDRLRNDVILRRLTDIGPDARSAVPELLKRFDGNALAFPIKAIGLDPEHSKLILDLIEPLQWYQRTAWLQVLINGKAKSKEIVTRLTPMLKENSLSLDQVRLRVLLCNADPEQRAKLIPQLLDRLRNPYAHMSPDVAQRVQSSQNSGRELWQNLHAETVRELSALDPPAKEVLPVLEQVASTSELAYRGYVSLLPKLTPDDPKKVLTALFDVISYSADSQTMEQPGSHESMIEPTMKLAKHADPEVRELALLTLVELGANLRYSNFAPGEQPARELERKERLNVFVQVFTEAEKDGTPSVRAVGVRGLRVFAPERVTVAMFDAEQEGTRRFMDHRLHALVELLKRAKATKQYRTEWEMLPAWSGESLSKYVPDLIDFLKDSTEAAYNHWYAVANALAKVGPSCVPQIVEILEGGDFFKRELLLGVIAKFGPDGTSVAIPMVTKLLTDEFIRVRLQAAVTLSLIMEEPPAEVVPMLREILTMTDDPMKYGAMTYEKESRSGKFQNPEDAYKRRAARDRLICYAALIRADWANRQSSIDQLTIMLRSKDKDVSLSAASAMRKLGPAVQLASPVIVEMLGEAADSDKLPIAKTLRAVDVEAAKKAGVR